MAYLELSMEAYNDLIIAAGTRAGRVSAVCNAQGVWSKDAQADAPVDAVPEHDNAAADDQGQSAGLHEATDPADAGFAICDVAPGVQHPSEVEFTEPAGDMLT